ncbi:hypothetical protein SNEBB_007148 [Seison nebaliae]|nr:hypothetical protein SNEBB_007148 [Seison nebaliae]
MLKSRVGKKLKISRLYSSIESDRSQNKNNAMTNSLIEPGSKSSSSNRTKSINRILDTTPTPFPNNNNNNNNSNNNNNNNKENENSTSHSEKRSRNRSIGIKPFPFHQSNDENDDRKLLKYNAINFQSDEKKELSKNSTNTISSSNSNSSCNVFTDDQQLFTQINRNNSNSNGISSKPHHETLNNRFQFNKTLGKGTYGKVKLASDRRTGGQVAIKSIRKSRIENPHDLDRIRREIFMSNLDHPHIIKIREVYESKEKIILVMEYAARGELYDYLNRKKRIPENEARGIFRQIVSAVHFLHKNRIVHRDLKLENILIDSNGDVKLADFGLSNTWSPKSLLNTFCGSPLYASPEIVKGIPYYGPEVDCWSLGVLLYTLIYGNMPYQGENFQKLTRQISTGTFFEPPEKSDAYSLIRKCLCVNPAKRASIDQIAEHWWINIGYRYPPVVFFSYLPQRHGIQALSYKKSPKVN